MVLKLYGNPHSTCTNRVRTVAEELGVPLELVTIDFAKGEQKAPEHTKYNPNGRIPTLVDHKNGDFTVWCVGFLQSPYALTLSRSC